MTKLGLRVLVVSPKKQKKQNREPQTIDADDSL